MKEHRAPWECTYAKEDKSKCKSGKKPKSDQEYFEVLCLCILQAGLSWGMIRKNWKKYRRGFYNFNINKLAKISPKELMKKPDVIKNLRKIEGIIYNAKEFQKIKEEYGSFSKFLKSLKQMKDKEIFRLLMKSIINFNIYYADKEEL